MHYLTDPIKQYAVFTGRATRKQFWMWTLWVMGISIVLGIIDEVSGAQIQIGDSGLMPIGILSSLFSLGLLLPALAIAVRRLHDTGRSGWWYLLIFVCCFGGIVLIVFYCLPSSLEDNKYGPNPNN
jgi:uncharacterized membrane protein YhaH (DUF805 family)